MRNSTLLFLIKKEDDKISHICLAMKKRGFGKGRYNGVGGKVESEESIVDAVRREAYEEVLVTVGELTECAQISFTFPHNPSFDQHVYVYVSEDWKGDVKETEEMAPSWYRVEDIPYDQMWPDDIFWLPLVLEGKTVRGRFVFGEKDVIVEQEVSLL